MSAEPVPVPQTPPRDPEIENAIRTEVQITPYNDGVAASAPYMDDTRRSAMAKRLVEDVKRTALCDMNSMLHEFARRICMPSSITPPAVLFGRIVSTVKGMEDTPEIKGDLNDFLNAESEELSYIPWVRMTNAVLWALRDKSVPDAKAYNDNIDLIHLIHDPSTLEFKMNNTKSLRSPDAVFVPRVVASMLYKLEDWRELAKKCSVVPPTKRVREGQGKGGKGKGNTGKRNAKAKTKAKTKRKREREREQTDLPSLDWGDVLLCVEHKRKRNFKPQSVNVRPLNRFTKDLHGFDEVLIRERLWDAQNAANQRPLFPSKKRKRENGDEGEGEGEGDVDVDVDKRSPKKRRPVGRSKNHSVTGLSFARHNGATTLSPPGRADLNEKKSVAIQAAEYGILRLCCSYDITHSIIFIVNGTIIYISWYDHEGIITTSGFDIAKFPSYYFALLFILQRFDRADWGRCSHPSLDTTTDKFTVDRKEFVIDALLSKSLAIGGRASMVLECQEEEAPPRVVKFEWKDSSRQSEGETLITARARARERGNSALLSNIPEVVAAETFSNVSTSRVRKALGIKTHSREFTALVMTKLDGRISELQGWELWDVLWKVIDIHHQLWGLGIKHRDISVGNIMFWRDPMTRGIHARLIDFDLASVTGTGDSTQHNRRTGSIVFMACALLDSIDGEGIPHVYEHDVESFFWVAMWVVFCRGKKCLKPKCPLLKWDKMDAGSFAAVKQRSFSLWFSKLESSQNRREWEQWNPFFKIIKQFWNQNFSPTDDPKKIYLQLLSAKSAAELSLRRSLEEPRVHLHGVVSD